MSDNCFWIKNTDAKQKLWWFHLEASVHNVHHVCFRGILMMANAIATSTDIFASRLALTGAVGDGKILY